MATLAQMSDGLERAWGNLAEGWQQLRQRAAQALTHFSPRGRSGDAEKSGDVFLQRASRWGVLAADVCETDSQLLVRLEAPGMEPDDFDLQVVDDVLLVRGEKHVRREQTEGRFHTLECAYGRFERAIRLPVSVDGQAARASYRRGVLSVHLPRKSGAKVKHIEVQAS